ncbi:hypothetical protein EDD86DRAFT_209577 [Gorgonomyces haynaldii]|nr:hypothetical protein EDD86DRAFT_209577 [Gorgonomyces haynaldii]
MFCKQCGEMDGRCQCGGEKVSIVPISDKPSQLPDQYLSGGFRAGVENGLKRMLGDSKVDLKCFGCQKQLKSADAVYPGLHGPEEGLPFCESCFGVRWSKGACSKCQKPISGQKQWVREGNQLFHKECYAGKSCSVCQEVIFGEAISVERLLLHPKCFQCHTCSKPIQGPFSLKDESIICGDCSQTLTQQKKTVSNSNVFQHIPKDKIIINSNGRELCVACNKALGTQDKILKLDEKLIHAQCLVCQACKTPIDNQEGFKRTEKGIFHPSCLQENVEKCFKCQKPMSGKYLSFEGKSYHADCFTCNQCRQTLQGQQFGKHEDKIMCAGCLESLMRDQARQEARKREPGFTINPKTGQKETRTQEFGQQLSEKLKELKFENKCPRCTKTVYPADQVPGPFAMSWHRQCLKCVKCNKSLDSNCKVVEQDPMCSDCFLKK